MDIVTIAIDYRSKDKLIRNCWCVKIKATAEIVEGRTGDEFVFDQTCRHFFQPILNSLPGCLQLSEHTIQIIVNDSIHKSDSKLPGWIKRMLFQVSRGESHPDMQ